MTHPHILIMAVPCHSVLRPLDLHGRNMGQCFLSGSFLWMSSLVHLFLVVLHIPCQYTKLKTIKRCNRTLKQNTLRHTFLSFKTLICRSSSTVKARHYHHPILVSAKKPLNLLFPYCILFSSVPENLGNQGAPGKTGIIMIGGKAVKSNKTKNKTK